LERPTEREHGYLAPERPDPGETTVRRIHDGWNTGGDGRRHLAEAVTAGIVRLGGDRNAVERLLSSVPMPA
jgi:hypothetical protein